MNLEVITQPYEVSFARNQIFYRLKANNLYQGTFQYPYIEIKFYRKAIAGEAFQFDFVDPDSGKTQTLVFKAEASPNNLGDEFIDDSFAGTIVEYTAEVYSQLQQNHVMATFYVISVDDAVIRFTAKNSKPGLVPTNDQLTLISLTNYPEISINDVSVEPTKRAAYRVLFEVAVEKEYLSNNYTLVAPLEDTPNSDGIVEFDLSSILKSEINDSFTEPPLPDYNLATVQTNALLRRYYVRYCIYYKGDKGERRWTSEPVKYVHCGGISLEDYAKQNPFHYFKVKKQFATWHPGNKIISTNQKDWLTWINYTNKAGDFTVVFNAYFDDGTSAEFYSAGATTLNKWESLTIPVGYLFNSISTLETASKKAYKLSVKINDGVDDVSAEFSYLFNRLPDPCERSIVYLNSFCAPESFQTSGRWEEMIQTEKATIDKTLGHNYTVINGQEFQFDGNSRIKFIARSGLMDKKTLYWLKGMLSEVDCFVVEDNMFTPIIIDPNSYLIDKCEKHVNDLQFNLKKSFRMMSQSEMDRIPTYEIDYDCGVVGIKIYKNGRLAIGSSEDLVITEPENGTEYEYPIQLVAGYGWEFPHPITVEGIYNAKFKLNDALTGEIFEYDFDFLAKVDHFYIETDDWLTWETAWRASEAGQDLKVDYQVNPVIQTTTVGTTITDVDGFLSAAGPKTIDYFHPCMSKFNSFVLSNASVLKMPNLHSIPNLEDLFLQSCNLTGYLDVSHLHALKFLRIEDNQIEAIDFGFHKWLVELILEDNNLSAKEIEAILYEVWKYRDMYHDADGISISLLNNPGAATNMTSKSLDIINGTDNHGTDEFVGQGLVTHYSMSIYY